MKTRDPYAVRQHLRNPRGSANRRASFQETSNGTMSTNDRPTYPDNLPAKKEGRKSGKRRSNNPDPQGRPDKSGDGDKTR